MELMHNKKRDELRLPGEEIFDFVKRSGDKVGDVDSPYGRQHNRQTMIVRLHKGHGAAVEEESRA